MTPPGVMTARPDAAATSRLHMDLQSYIYESHGSLTFADLLTAFPGVPTAHLVNALTDLEAMDVVTFFITHSAHAGVRANR